MRSAACLLLFALAACDQPGHEGDVTGLHVDGATASEAGGCAVAPGGCIGGGGDGGHDAGITIDGDVPDASFDATTSDAALPLCQVPTGGNHFTVRSPDGTSPAFVVQHVWATWAPAPMSCGSPQLFIALSDAATCVDGAGEQLAITFFTSGTLAPMTMPYMFGTTTGSAIGLEFITPATPTLPSQTLSCVVGGGTITFDSVSWPPMAGSNHVSGTLSVQMFPCGSATMMPSWTIDGSFDVLVDTAAPCP